MSTIAQNLAPVKGLSAPYRDKHLQALQLADVYDHLYQQADTAQDLDRWESKRDRVRCCGTLLMGDVYERITCVNGEIAAEESYRLTGANFCRVSLCPTCQWRRASKLYGTLIKSLGYMLDEYKLMEFDDSNHRLLPKLRMLLLTLTVPSVSGDALRDAIRSMSDGWNRLQRVPRLRVAVKGYYRCLEVTYNARSDTYHPHYHVLLITTEAYFARSRSDYISHAEWLDMWRKAMRDSSITQVDVRPLRGCTPSALLKSLSEVCKYTCKPSDYLRGSMEQRASVVGTIDKALDKVRRASWGGCLKAAKAALVLDEDVIEQDYTPDSDWYKVQSDVWLHWSSGVGDYVKI